MELTFKELVKAINGTILVDNNNHDFKGFCIDTRKVNKDDIFVAIKGERFN